MYEETLHSLEDRLVSVGVEATWTQWSAVGAGALHNDQRASSIIDPEALLLFSLYLIPAERRLRDLVRWWAQAGSELLSVQRTRTLLDDFPSEVSRRLGMYSHWAAQAGDKRWRTYADEWSAADTDRDRKGPEDPDLSSPSSLLLRLRAGFGVSAKADILAFLLGIGEQSATTKKATEATGYSRATVSGALDDLSRAGFIQKTGGRPAEYRAPHHAWMNLLHRRESVDTPPKWRYWGQMYAFLIHTREWAREANSQSEYVLSTRARDTFEAFQGAFEANHIRVPSPAQYQGTEYLDGFIETTEEIIQWIPEHV